MMPPHEIAARFLYDLLGRVRHDNRPLVPFEAAEYSSTAFVQDSYFKASQLATSLLDQLDEHGYVVKQRRLEPVE